MITEAEIKNTAISFGKWLSINYRSYTNSDWIDQNDDSYSTEELYELYIKETKK